MQLGGFRRQGGNYLAAPARPAQYEIIPTAPLQDIRLFVLQIVNLRRGPSFCAEDFRLGLTLCPTIDTDPKSRSYL